MKISKIIAPLVIFFLLSVGVASYLNRYHLVETFTFRLAKSLLPPYVGLRNLELDFKDRTVTFKDITVLNPKGYNHKYILQIPEARAVFIPNDTANISKGLKLKNIELINPIIRIERRKDRLTNVQQMSAVFGKYTKPRTTTSSKAAGQVSGQGKKDRLVDLEYALNVKNGTIIFEDSYIGNERYNTSIDGIETRLVFDMQKGTDTIGLVRSEGRGFLNKDKQQTIQWTVELDPSPSSLRLSSAFNIMNIGVAHFKPYYDSFSPFLFQDGKTSGKLVFNFDNGNIGSTNELKFSELKLTMKEDYADKGLWYLSTEDLYVYLTSTADEIIFDFKIKGPIERPRFMPGSNTKRALALLALNKIMKVGNELQKQLQADMVPAGSEPDSENSAEPLPPAR